MVRRVGIMLSLLTVVCGAIGAAPASARMSKGVATSSVKLYIQQALTAKEQADRDTLWSKAARVGQEGLLEDPGDPQLNMYVGKAFASLNRGKDAGTYFARGIASLEAKQTEVTAKGGKMDKKELDLLKNLKAERYNAALPFRNKGAESFQEGQTYRSADTPNADSAKVAFTRAIDMFTSALAIDPTQTDMFQQLAFAYIFSDQKMEGRAVLMDALAHNPADTLLPKNIAMVDVQIAQDLQQKKDVDGAIAYLMQADSLDASTSYDIDIANMLLERGANSKNKADLARAEELYTKVLATYPADFHVSIAGKDPLDEREAHYKNALNNLAEAQRHGGKTKESLANYEKLMYLEPRNLDVWNIHAYFLQELKLTDKLTSDLRVIKALKDGQKADVASALGAGSPEVKAAVAKYGNPGEVYFYTDATSQKKVVTYFFWKGGVAITTAGGVKLAETQIPKLPN